MTDIFPDVASSLLLVETAQKNTWGTLRVLSSRLNLLRDFSRSEPGLHRPRLVSPQLGLRCGEMTVPMLRRSVHPPSPSTRLPSLSPSSHSSHSPSAAAVAPGERQGYDVITSNMKGKQISSH